MRTLASSFPSNNSNLSPASMPTPAHATLHSPVPYLFSGLAAMLGLIACALLILACSYWHLSGRGDGDGSSNRGQGGDGKQADGEAQRLPDCFGEGLVVIMPGDEKPSFVATPIPSGAEATATEGKVAVIREQGGEHNDSDRSLQV